MPASSSETRNRWRKRKRGPQITRKPKPQDDYDIEDEDDEDEEFDEDNQNQQQQQPPPPPPQPPQQQNHRNPNPNPNGNASNSLDLVAPILRETEVLLDGGVRICSFPTVVRHTVNRPHSSVLAILAMESGRAQQQLNGVVLENLSYGQLQALSSVPANSPALGMGDQERENGAYVITPPAIMEGSGVVKRFGINRVHVVPMHADWFSPNTVHRLERQVVPHFFSGKSVDHTPEKYMGCRNRIVAKYMENPEDRLLVPDCQGLVVGVDVDDITRIVRFLDQWGIINYCASAPDHEPRNVGSCWSEDSNGELSLPVETLKSIDSLIQFDKPKCRLKAENVYPELACHDDDASDLDSRIRERLSENRCNHCSRPVPIVSYQSQKEVDVLLCSDCFHDGIYVTGHSSLDFVRVDSMKEYGDMDGDNWTDQETLLLLEAMELYNESWNEIAEHVGTKSKAQCILHFIRLPIDDAPLENIEVQSTISTNLRKKDDFERSHSNSNGNFAGSSLQDLDSDNRLPFANSGNPVMALVAFLASAVGPRVAAACAHASLAALSESVPASGNAPQIDGSEFGNRMNVESMHGREGSPHGETTKSSQQKEENSGQGPWSQRDAEVTPLSGENVRAAAKAGLAAAAAKAKLFADHEEREIQRLSANIVNHQLKRLELKLKQCAEVETLLMKECEQVERVRQRIAAERALMVSNHFGPAGGGSGGGSVNRPTGSLPGPGGPPPPMVNNSTAINNSRQQVVSGSPSQQPFISRNNWGQYGMQQKMQMGSITR